MTIRRKLFAGYGALLAIPAFVVVGSILINDRIRRDVLDVSSHAHAEAEAAHHLGTAVAAVEIRLWQLAMARNQDVAAGGDASDGSLRTARAGLDAQLIGLRKAAAVVAQPSVDRASHSTSDAAAEAHELAFLDQLKIATGRLETDARKLDAAVSVMSAAEAQQAVYTMLTGISRDIAPALRVVTQDAQQEMASTSDAFGASTRMARRLEAGAMVVAVALAVVVGTVTARSIFRPIATLRQAALRMGAGDLETPVSLASHDEMGVLGDALQQMARDLRQTMTALTEAVTERDRVQAMLQQFNAELENTVQERTAQLNQVIDVAPFGATVYHLTPDDRLVLVSANRSADVILKVSTSQFLGKTIEEAFPAIAGTPLPVQCRRTAREGIAHHVGPITYAENGISGSFDLHLVPLGPDRMTVFFRDVTELVQAYDQTLAGWSHAMDLRDRETEGHTQRVTEMTLRLARGMGIGETELVYIRWGALLHDIGKIGVPDSILLKPGPLTESEWAIMRRHPEIARDMLAPIGFLGGAISIPYGHHERWDGTGYPQGLAGHDIPPNARIFAVADVWDALRSERSYHPAWTHEQAHCYIRAQAGKQFDPAVVEVFERLMERPDEGESHSPLVRAG